MFASLKISYDKPRQHIKTQRYHFANTGLYSQSYGFSSSHVWTWELDHKEGWALKNWCFWIVVLESSLDSKLIKSVNPKGNQPWIFIGGIDVEAEAPVLWPPNVKSRFIGKDPDAGQEKGAAEDEIVGWIHWLTWTSEQAPADSEGWGSLVCCCPWGHKELDMT